MGALVQFSGQSTPTDNVGNAGPTVTITPPANMLAGDYVVVFAQYRDSAGTLTVGTTGGQSWTSETQVNTGNVRFRLFHCRFNGTWSANPTFTVTSGNNALTVAFLVYRGVDKITGMDVTPVSGTFAAPGSPFDVTIAANTITSVTHLCLLIAAWATADDNTWAMQTAGWSSALGTAQVRNTTGQDQSISVFHGGLQVPSGNAAVTNRQTALGGDAGCWYILALRTDPRPEVYQPWPRYSLRR